MTNDMPSLAQSGDDELVHLLRIKLPEGLQPADVYAKRSTQLTDSRALGTDTSIDDSSVELQSLLSRLQPPSAANELANIPGYRLLSVLGVGGMGVVFEAEDTTLGRHVAIKLIRQNRFSGATSVERFLREARAAALLAHDNIVTVYHVGTHNDVPYLVMQLLRGESLAQRLRRVGMLDIIPTLQIVRQVALGLNVAFAMKILHRDIKPDNIWLDSDNHRVRILDFGLAQFADADGRAPGELSLGGTPNYIAPERLLGHPGDERADLFSLGVVLYESLTGDCPFRASGAKSKQQLTLTASPVPFPTLPELDAPVRALMKRLLEKDPSRRLSSAAALVQEIDTILNRSKTEGQKRLRKWSVIASMAIVIALFIAAGVGLRGSFAGRRMADALSRQRLYPAKLREAQAAKDSGNFTRMAEILEELRPGPNEADLRGWEWHYLDRFRPSPTAVVRQGALGFSAFVCQGNRMAFCCEGASTFFVKDVENNATICEIPFADSRCVALALSADGQRVACSSESGRVQVWDTMTATLLLDVSQIPCCLALNATGNQVVCGGAERICVYDVDSRRLVQSLEQKNLSVDTGRVIFSPDGRRCAIGIRFAAFLFVYDTATWRVTAEFRPYNGQSNHRYFGVAWHPNSIQVAVVSAAMWDTRGTLQIFNSDTRKVERVFAVMHNHVADEACTALAFNTQGDRIAVGEFGGRLRVYNAGSGEALCDIPGGGCEWACVSFSENGLAIVAGSKAGNIGSIGWRDQIPFIETDGVGRSDWTPDSIYLISKSHAADQAEQILVIDALSGLRLKSLPPPTGSWIPAIACAPTGSSIAFSAQTGSSSQDRFPSDGCIYIVEPESGETLRRIPAPFYKCLTWSPDARYLAGGQVFVGLRVTVWDPNSGQVVWENDSEHREFLASVAFSPDGTYLASKDESGRIVLWNATTGEKVTALGFDSTGQRFEGGQWTLEFSPDGDQLAAAFGESLRIWNVNRRNCVRSIAAHAGSTESLSWSPDGKRLATGGHDGLVKIWDAGTGQLLLTFQEESSVALVDFSADGSMLATHTAPIGKVRIRNANSRLRKNAVTR